MIPPNEEIQQQGYAGDPTMADGVIAE